MSVPAEPARSREAVLQELLELGRRLHDGGLEDLLSRARRLYSSQGSGQRPFADPADLPPLHSERRRELLSHTSTGRKILAEEDAARREGGAKWL
jgi:hypothetical protein